MVADHRKDRSCSTGFWRPRFVRPDPTGPPDGALHWASHCRVRPGSTPVKKGRHRRFEEARKLKQSGPEAFGAFGPRESDSSRTTTTEDDEYAELAAKYGVEFDDDDDLDDEDD